MQELTPEETTVVLLALKSWLRKTAAEAGDLLRRDPSKGHAMLDDTIKLERLIQKFQF
jgi:hypothetical protein